MKIVLMLLVLLVPSVSLACDERKCGDFEINVLGLVEGSETHPPLVKVALSNETCAPVGLSPEIGDQGRLVFTRESPVRWESQATGSEQWVAYTGLYGEPRPIGKITLLLQKHEHSVVYVELGVAEAQMRDGKLRVFLTDSQGVSRSSNVFQIDATPRVKTPH